MEELNNTTLQEALKKLPQHSPPADLWDEISMQLEQDLADQPLHAAIQDLPIHNPPIQLWDSIEAELEKVPEENKKPRIRRLWQIAAAAAAIAALIYVSPQFILQEQSIDYAVATTVSEEIIDPRLLARDWQEDEPGFEFLEQLCSSKPFLCSNPDLQNLKSELGELTEAKNTLEIALGNYGTDVYLIQQLKEIELERTKILKEMLERMI